MYRVACPYDVVQGPRQLKPIRDGWFFIMRKREKPHRYKLGAMLLDLDDPTKILHCASAPVLTPDAQYENDGKPGIVYACGATSTTEICLSITVVRTRSSALPRLPRLMYFSTQLSKALSRSLNLVPTTIT